MLVVVSAATAALVVVPAPSFRLWAARVASLETSLAMAGVAIFAMALAATDRTPRGRARTRALALAAVPAALTMALPNAAAVPLYARRHVSFSAIEYLGGGWPLLRVTRDVALDPDRALLADVYRPDQPGPHPFVVVIHGGSWRGGDKGAERLVSAAIAAHGYVVLDVQYGLAPAHRFPRAISDVKCLLGRARENARRLDIDPRRAALLGRSAGGQIALVSGYSSGDSRLQPSCAVRDEPVSAVVALYPPTDLVAGYDAPVRPDVVRGPAALEGYLGGSPRERPEAYRLATPQSWLDRALPPTLLVHGSGDRLVHVSHSRELARALEASGRRVEYLEIPYAEHAFDFRWGGVAEQLARSTILSFLAGTLGPP
jgi:acetyl esterase/lipase